jgi:hypothetical protein
MLGNRHDSLPHARAARLHVDKGGRCRSPPPATSSDRPNLIAVKVKTSAQEVNAADLHAERRRTRLSGPSETARQAPSAAPPLTNVFPRTARTATALR